MKKKHFGFLFLAMLVLCITNVQAQVKCKYDVDKKDPITDKQIRNISISICNSLFGNIVNWKLGLEKVGEDYDIAGLIFVNGTVNDFLEKGDSLMIKFSNHELVTLYAKSRITPYKYAEQSANGTQMTSYNSICYPITTENFNKFTSSMITYVQMNIGSRAYQSEVKEKIALKIMNSAICIMQ